MSHRRGKTSALKRRHKRTANTTTHTHPNTPAAHKHVVKTVQTLSVSRRVYGVDMRPTEDMTAAILVTAIHCDVGIFRTPLSGTQPIKFELLKRFRAHTSCIYALHLHPTKRMFVSAGAGLKVKIWSLQKMKAPLLVDDIKHPASVFSARYSHSGLLLTGCDDGVLRVYDVEPLCCLRWRCKLAGRICSVAWSPCNRIAASFKEVKPRLYAVAVWDSTFHIMFKRKQKCVLNGNHGLSFASDDLLLCSSGTANNLCLYNIPTATVTAYAYRYPKMVRAVTALSAEIICTSCVDNKLRVYKLHGRNNQLRLLATLPYQWCTSLASCVYPHNDAGYVLASTDCTLDVRISVTSRFNRYWVRAVTYIMLNSKILPFCRDVQKIVFKYLR